MAFGSHGAGGDAAHADVELGVNLGKFRAEIGEARQVYEGGIKAMSSESIKLALATEKVERALAKYPPDSAAVARAELTRRRAIDEVTASTRRNETQTESNTRALRASERAAHQTAGAYRSLRSGVGLAVGALIGGGGLFYALKQTISAAREAETVKAQLGNAVRRAGIDYDVYADKIESALQAQAKMSSFDDEELAASFTTFVRRTKDVNEALELNALAANVARGRNISLEAAMQLVLKASLGQVGGLRRAGIEIDKNATATEALAKLQQAYGQSAATFAKTSEGQQERWNKVLGDTKEIIGTGVLPAVNDLLGRGADYLEQLNESGELQERVNDTLDKAAEVAHGFADGLKLIHTVTGPVIDAIGGLDNAVETFLILGAVRKVQRFARAFPLVTAASAVTRTAVIRDQVAIQTAVGTTTTRLGATGLLGALGRLVASPWVIPIVLGVSFSGEAADWLRSKLDPDGSTPDWMWDASALGGELWKDFKRGLGVDGQATPPGPKSITVNKGPLPTLTSRWQGSGRQPAGVPQGALFPVTQGQWSTVGAEHPTSGLQGFPAVDIMSNPAATVVAPEQGVITRLSGSPPSAYRGGSVMGYSLYLLGDSGTTYFMTHLSSVLVKPGARVNAGQPIATVAAWPGDRGRTHVHVGVAGKSGARVTPPTGGGSGTRTTADYEFDLLRADTDPERLALMRRRRGWLEATIDRLEHDKTPDEKQMKRLTTLYQELDEVRRGITGIYRDRNAASKRTKTTTSSGSTSDPFALDRARVEFLKTKASTTATLKDDIAAAGEELRLIRELKAKAKEKSAEWWGLKGEEAQAQTALEELQKQRAANLRKQEDRDRVERVMRAARKLGIVYGGPGAGGPVMDGTAGDAWKHPLLTQAQMLQAQQQFLATMSSFASQLAPNFYGGQGRSGSTVTVHQHFPSAPSDQHREARYAQFAWRFGGAWE